MTGRWIEDMACPEVGRLLAERWPVVVPIGARAKQHGPHLPMCTDFLLARALADGIAAVLPVLIAPVIDFGSYHAFARYPGSQSLRAETFMALLRDVLNGLLDQGATAVAVVNTGFTTEEGVTLVLREMLLRRGARIGAAHLRTLSSASARFLESSPGGHADELETSLMLAIAPERVQMAYAADDPGRPAEPPLGVFAAPTLFADSAGPGRHVSATGARGNPTLATAAKGRAILAHMVTELVAGLRPLCPGAT
ncbi:MAG: creatininase family protein [Acidisphaera sp.]|nr:creatininase family protein [Acidisphaera sp.]